MRPSGSLHGTILATAMTLALGRAVSTVGAENWPQWRGPNANGHSSETGLPTSWGEGNENILWKVPLEGRGTSTPIVWDDLIIVTSQTGSGPLDLRGAEFEGAVRARDAGGAQTPVRFLTRAHHRTDGRLVWGHAFDAAGDEGALPSVHPKHNLASPSAVTDGELVIVWMGTGQIAALDMEGQLRWERHIGRDYARFDVLWGHGSSPLLYRDKVILQCDHPPGAYLLALDKKSGKEVWRVNRPEGIRSYSTPFVVHGDSGDQLVVNSSHRMEAYDPEKGEPLWHVGEPVTLAIPMPVFHGGVLYASRGYTSGPYFALRLDGNEPRVTWRVPTRAPYISSLIYNDGLLYMGTERGIVSVIDAQSGETIWRERLGGVFTASPIAADGKIFFLAEDGETVVLAAGRPPSVIARNRLEERTLASPAVSRGRLYIRSDSSLFAIGR